MAAVVGGVRPYFYMVTAMESAGELLRVCKSAVVPALTALLKDRRLWTDSCDIEFSVEMRTPLDRRAGWVRSGMGAVRDVCPKKRNKNSAGTARTRCRSCG